MVLRHVFLADENFATSGVVLPLDEDHILFYAAWEHLVADEDAERATWGVQRSIGAPPMLHL